MPTGLFSVDAVSVTLITSTLDCRKTVILLILPFFNACTTTPVLQDSLHDPSLQQILAVYRQAVSQVYLDSRQDWHNGWVGNIRVNLGDISDKGLCYHWQQLTYDAIATTVKSLQWDAIGITINYDTLNEHNAVLVFDPEKIAKQNLLTNLVLESAYVLDPWPAGKADVYSLSDWLAMPLLRHKPAELKELHESQALSQSQAGE